MPVDKLLLLFKMTTRSDINTRQAPNASKNIRWRVNDTVLLTSSVKFTFIGRKQCKVVRTQYGIMQL